MQVFALLALLLPSLLATAAPLGKGAFEVRAKVLSGWPQTPSAAQSLEWIRDVDASQAADFLRQLCSDQSLLKGSDVAAAEALLKSSSARTYHELLVRNSFYSPRIESLRSLERTDRQLYGGACPQGSAWALLWRNSSDVPSVACDVAALRRALGQEPGGGIAASFARSRLDLQLRQGAGKGVVVLYGAASATGLPSLSPLVQEVAALQKSSAWEVVFRHADGPSGPEGLGADLLTGYGFELAIKSSEYKTHAEDKKEDEEKEAEQQADAGDGDDADSDLELNQTRELDGPLEMDGLLFHTLLDRHPSVRARIWAFKEQLEVERDTDQILKAWEIKDIGLQATAKIKSSQTPLLALMRLSQNFPSHVVGLSQTSVPPTLRSKLKALRMMMRDGDEVFSMNGRLVRPDHSELSLFPLMQTLHPFFLGVERLVRLGVSEAIACEILKEIKGSGKSASRLDWRSPALPPPIYMVEKDRETQRWGASLQSLLFGFGGLSPVRLPLYIFVFVFDPAEAEDLAFASALLQQMPLPGNVHLVMAPPASAANAAVWDEQVLGQRPKWLSASSTGAGSVGDMASTAIAAAFGHMLQKGRKRAQSFLSALQEWSEANLKSETSSSGRRWPNTEEGVEKIKSLWTATAQKRGETADMDKLWEEVLSNATKPGSYVTNCTGYAASIGVPMPSLLINGKLMLKGAYDGQSAIQQSVYEEQHRLQQAIYTGQLSDVNELAEHLLSQGVLSAYHPDIAPDVGERGGEEGMQSQTKEVHYHLWSSQPFLQLPFLASLEPERSSDEAKGEAEGSGSGAISFYHVVLLRTLRQAYLLQTFASHLLSPGRDASAGQDLSSHFAVAVDGSGSGPLAELGACVRGIMRLEAEAGSDHEEKRSVNRQKLTVLKFLGAAVPAAVAADPALSGDRVQDLCRLATEKKIELQLRPRAEALVAEARKSGAPEEEAALLADAATGDASGAAAGATWVCNGRRIDLQDGGQPISAAHVQALELLEAQWDLGEDASENSGGKEQAPSTKALSEWLAADAAKGTPAMAASAYGLVAAIRSEVLTHGKNERFTQPAKIFEAAPPAFRLHLPPAKPDAASPITVYGILDPLSTTAQSASAALALFGMAFNAEVNLVLNPPTRVTEYPLKRYYREVVRWPERLADGHTLAELEDGVAVGSGKADFALATQHTLTAAVHALPTWLVTAREAENDMDNLRPVDIGPGGVCETTYVLRQLYVEGQAMILGDEGWPTATAKGMQFEITGKGAREASDDTIVMGNLGYFQVRGNPGLYKASLKSGLSNETFELTTTHDLEVSSYITPPHQLRVRLRPGKSHDDLFAEEAGKSAGSKSTGGGLGILGALRSVLGGGDGSESKDSGKQLGATAGSGGEELETIHIFSVASGHLYEKLLGIMILSVRNNTKNPLHFWFIDQFLSPKFKAFIPLMAKRYDFKYDFVTYKWPSWLNPQSEKQRLIWAYKILFLDVLFPQDVPKILFIDADQVVRADVRELWDLDLQGKVYGFVPMGDTNPDTEGFRFWKQGYWNSHLGGNPYHISALFVVDLIKFRRTSIGEVLRGIYNQLSRDPNSLANLDQDLPNFAQHQVPIFSLPADWLWCETWCSQESKKFAKTIDLCQNPLTKEPKIVMAKRIISEWQMYHDSVQSFQEELESAHAALPGHSDVEAPGKVEL